MRFNPCEMRLMITSNLSENSSLPWFSYFSLYQSFRQTRISIITVMVMITMLLLIFPHSTRQFCNYETFFSVFCLPFMFKIFIVVLYEISLSLFQLISLTSRLKWVTLWSYVTVNSDVVLHVLRHVRDSHILTPYVAKRQEPPWW